MPYLFLTTLGPVQDFIFSARRSRDLWFGSWLLSDLSKTAARVIANRNGIASLIFPAPQNQVDLKTDSSLSVANKIVAVINQPPVEVGKMIRDELMKRLHEIRDDAFDRKRIPGPFRRQVADQQIDDMLEYFWVALPLDDVANYSIVHAQLEALMAARKVTRDFGPVTWGDAIPKSSLDGLRESVIPEPVFDQMRGQEDQLRRLYGIRRGERLCGVGLLKRHGRKGIQDRFFSTSHVAALPLIQRIPATARPAVMQYIAILQRLGISDEDLGHVPSTPHPAFADYDGHLLFEERLAEFFDGPTLIAAKQALADFLKVAVDGRRPLPYYGLLIADGDRMGKVIDHQQTWADHQRLSQTLSAFAGKVPQIVSQHSGSLVYAGGDDILAFVPLHSALDCLRILANTFRQTLSGFRDKEGVSPTLSAGLAICHHLEPLSDALILARNAEKDAKRIPGKNALAVTLSKRSGVDRTVAGVWGTVDERLSFFAALHRAEAIPDGAAYELRDLALRLSVPKTAANHAILQEAMRTEAVRILRRKKAERGAQAIDDVTLPRLKALIAPPSAAPPPVDVMQIADELVIARVFADASELAASEFKKEES